MRAASHLRCPRASSGCDVHTDAEEQLDDGLHCYSSQVKACYYAIQSNKDKFKVLPVGPLGMEVSVDDKHSKWCVA